MFLKTEILNAISFKNPLRLPIAYWVLVLLRFILTLIPQRGYIHPDEFFQTVEVVAGDIFSVDVSRTWEFNPKFPIRNIFVPKLILGPPLYLIRILNPYSQQYLGIDLRTPYYLLVIPRLFICALSLINDYCLYRICILFGQNFKNRLTVFASSYVVLVYCCRSFSNTFEMIFFSILLLLVSECMVKSDKVIYHEEFLTEKYERAASAVDRVRLFKLRTHLPAHSLHRVLPIATVTILGIFNRPTFIAFALVPIFFWLHRGLGSKVVGFKDFHYRMLTLVVCGIPSVVFLVAVDSGYYGYITAAEVERLQVSWDSWVVTPLNFLRYNSDERNLRAHGLHPRWLHAVLHVPLLFSALGLLALATLAINTYRLAVGRWRAMPRATGAGALAWWAAAAPVALLSLAPHQEPRFIAPALPPLVYLYGNQLMAQAHDTSTLRRAKTALLYTWIATNVLLTIFFGFVHQGGIYPLARDLHGEILSAGGVHRHVVLSHSYSLPTYLLQLESTERVRRDARSGRRYRRAPTTFIHNVGSRPLPQLVEELERMLSEAEAALQMHGRRYRVYLAAPCSLHAHVAHAVRGRLHAVPYRTYYPHFSAEALPAFPRTHDRACSLDYHSSNNRSQINDLNILQRISCYVRMFCLRIYTVEAK